MVDHPSDRPLKSDCPALTPEEDAKRLAGLRSANGVGPWFGHRVFRRLILLVAATRMKGEIHGLDQLPQPAPTYYPPRYRRKGDSKISDFPFVVAPNHQHVLDIPLTGFIPRPMAWPSKPDFVRWTWLKWLNQPQGCIPFMRDVDWVKHPEYQKFTYTKGEMKDVVHRALRRGQPVVLYPQGTRRDDDDLSDAKLGAMYAALRANVPLVPLAIYGVGKTDEHRHTRLLRRSCAIAVVMEPIFPRDYMGGDRMVAHAMQRDWQLAIEKGRELAHVLQSTM